MYQFVMLLLYLIVIPLETLSDRFAIASHNQINVVLSAQQLVDCDTNNHGCTGGWPINAWNYMVKVG